MSDPDPSEGAVPDPSEGSGVRHRSADEVLSMELPLAFRGYRMREVDALLGELALQIAEMAGESDRTAEAPGPGTTSSKDDDVMREASGITAGARRRALVPSAALTVLAAVALVLGWTRGDRPATLVAIAGSVLALIGIAVAVRRTREATHAPATRVDRPDRPAADDHGGAPPPGR